MKRTILAATAALVGTHGANAADAIVIAAPEPVEYVRVCDVYGTGFFYIPGTQTCLQIGGYVRYQAEGTTIRTVDPQTGFVTRANTYSNFARFAPTFDARSENEWGTLRSFGQAFFEWDSLGGSDVYMEHVFIELQTANGSLLIGKTDNPFARFFDLYGADGHIDGDYGGQIYNSTEVSYTYTGDNGFSAVIAAIEAGAGTFRPNFEGGVNLEQSWGSLGGIVGYDGIDKSWGVKGVARLTFDPFTLGVHVLHSSSESGVYGAVNPAGTETSKWSVLAHVGFQATEKLGINGYFQWFDATASLPRAYQIKGGLNWRPIDGLEILPEVRYTHFDSRSDAWEGLLRVTREF